MATRGSIDKEEKRGRFDTFHDQFNPLLTEAQPKHTIGKKRPLDSIKSFHMSNLTAIVPFKLELPHFACKISNAIKILSEISLPWT